MKIMSQHPHQNASASSRTADRSKHDKSYHKSVVLVGLMGAGKTSLGSKLARHMGRPFIDSDKEIERVTNVRICDIFELDGEAHFREIEARTIEKILDGPPVVLSTGGGAFCQPGVRDLIKQKALSVWLDAPPEILLARIGNTKSRPLLHGDNPLKILKSLAEDRNPHYAKADLTLETDVIGLSHSVIKLAALVTAAIQQSESIDETE
jgi:shikimate kinase